MTMSIGKALPRKEDRRLLTGGGSYSDDVHLPDLAYAIVVRSPHAHARIRAIEDAGGAARCPACWRWLTGVDVCRRRAQADPAQSDADRLPPADIALQEPRRLRARPRAASDPADRSGALRRRRRGAWWWANTFVGRQGRRRADHDRLRAAAARDHGAVAAAQGGAPRAAGRARPQRLHRRGRGRCRRDRGSIRARRPCDPSGHLGAARDRRSARCAGGDRRL